MNDRIAEIMLLEFGANVVNIKRINEGFSHFMYEVSLDKAPFCAIVRFSNNTNPCFSLAKEIFVMNKLSAHNIPAPKIYAHTKEYIVLEKFSGKRLDTIWNSLSDSEKAQITKEIGILATKMHSITFDEFGEIQENGKIDSDDAFKFRKQGESLKFSPCIREHLQQFFIDLSRFMSYKDIPAKFISKTMTYLSGNLEKIEHNNKPVLAHGDFMPGHIFVDKIDGQYKITGLIDFEFASASAPEYDFIKLHRAGFFDNALLKKALDEGYGRQINTESVEMFRLMRDIGFAWAVRESGNKELSDKTIAAVDLRIDKLMGETI